MRMFENESPYECVIRKYQRIMIAVTFICFTLYACVLVPLYTQLSANVLYQNSPICTLLAYVIDIPDLVVFFIVFPITIYSIYARGFKESRLFIMIYPLLVIYKYTANYIASCITDGMLPTLETFFGIDIFFVGSYVFIELFQYALVCLFAHLAFSKARKIFEIKQKAAMQNGREYFFRDEIFPLNKIFAYKSPVCRTAFKSMIAFFLIRAFGHLIYQFVLLVYNGFNDGWFVLTVDLLSDVILSVIGYFVILLILQQMDICEMNICAEKEREDSSIEIKEIDI